MRSRHTHNKRPGAGFIGKAGRFVASLREGIGTGVDRKPPGGNGGDSLRHMSILLDSVTTAIISLDGAGKIRVFNAASEKLFGMPRSRMIGQSFAETGRTMSQALHACQPLWERLTDAVWAAGAAVELEYDLIQKNGARRVISYSVYPLGRMAWSLGDGVVIMLEDITRRKEMEDQVSDARKRLLAVFDGITDGIQVVDGDFRITALNKSMTVLFNGEIRVGGRCFESCSPDGKKCGDCPADETFRTGLPASTTKRLEPQMPDGAVRHLEINTFPLLDRGNRVVQVVEYIKNVTEKMQLAERLEHSRRLAELGEMAARVAHEVRNPLNAITGAAHFLSTEYTQDDTLQKFTSLIKRQAIRVNQVASDLLYLSKPLKTRFTALNVNAVIDQALDSLCEPARQKAIILVDERSPDLPLLQGDEVQLEQAFHNLLRNAVEAMPGGGRLRIITQKCDDRIEVRIHDSGQGIAEQDRDKIFQSFFTTKVKGTGLGLTIVQRVLRNHSGTIIIEQAEEGGTLVAIALPLQREGAYPADRAPGRDSCAVSGTAETKT